MTRFIPAAAQISLDPEPKRSQNCGSAITQIRRHHTPPVRMRIMACAIVARTSSCRDTELVTTGPQRLAAAPTDTASERVCDCSALRVDAR